VAQVQGDVSLPPLAPQRHHNRTERKSRRDRDARGAAGIAVRVADNDGIAVSALCREHALRRAPEELLGVHQFSFAFDVLAGTLFRHTFFEHLKPNANPRLV
jgi:hypothetical protein